MTTININHPYDWSRLAPCEYFRDLPRIGVGEPVVPVPLPRNQILRGDALARLRDLPDHAIDCVVTSPPYFLLRDYGVDGQIGLEASVDDWVEALRPVFHELARVLKPGGGLWLNIADTFSRSAGSGAPSKSMLLAPERLLLALAHDGWIVRSKVIWAKTNTMPNSVTDRLNTTYEPVYFLVRSPRYYFDLDAIREAATLTPRDIGRAIEHDAQQSLDVAVSDATSPILGTNPGDVWRIATKGFRGAHFATFPPDLVRRPIAATCPEMICTRCGTPLKRQTSTWRVPLGSNGRAVQAKDRFVMRFPQRWHTLRQRGDIVPCGCHAPTVPGVVLDPFFGAGTTALVAEELGRDWIGIELSDEYATLAEARLEAARDGP
ncbi:MAG: site-specific DNA-methyltransferase [Acidobacteriota bacterium]|nr:site-specific DNA-methyltransferase [Acidobacteriota bacterium]MDE3146817.1 site-specific DNA-methyltransferase [Acidobacteriota bacterium]